MQCTNIVAFVNHQSLKELNKKASMISRSLSLTLTALLCNCAIARKHFHLFRFYFGQVHEALQQSYYRKVGHYNFTFFLSSLVSFSFVKNSL